MSGSVGGGTNSETTSTDHDLHSTKRHKADDQKIKTDDIAHELEKEDWDEGKSRVHAKKGKKGKKKKKNKSNVSVSNASMYEYGDEEESENSDEADKSHHKTHKKIYPATKQLSIK